MRLRVQRPMIRHKTTEWPYLRYITQNEKNGTALVSLTSKVCLLDLFLIFVILNAVLRFCCFLHVICISSSLQPLKNKIEFTPKKIQIMKKLCTLFKLKKTKWNKFFSVWVIQAKISPFCSFWLIIGLCSLILVKYSYTFCLENVEIYYSKIDLKIFASDIIFVIAESFYTNKMRIF